MPDYTKMSCKEILDSWDSTVQAYFYDQRYGEVLTFEGRKIIRELIDRLEGKGND